MSKEPTVNATRVTSAETPTTAPTFMSTTKDKHQTPILTLEGKLFAEQTSMLGLE